MTLSELKQKHSDVILEELSWDDIRAVANGEALFYASLSSGKRPKDDRKVLWAGHILTAGINANDYLCFLRLSAEGNARTDSVSKQDIEQHQRAALFRTRSLPASDRRNLTTWYKWT